MADEEGISVWHKRHVAPGDCRSYPPTIGGSACGWPACDCKRIEEAPPLPTSNVVALPPFEEEPVYGAAEQTLEVKSSSSAYLTGHVITGTLIALAVWHGAEALIRWAV